MWTRLYTASRLLTHACPFTNAIGVGLSVFLFLSLFSEYFEQSVRHVCNLELIHPSSPTSFVNTVITSLCSASCVGCHRGTARICCWAPCSNGSVSLARRALSSKPAAAAWEWRDRQTDGRTPDRYTDPAPRTMWAVPMNRWSICYLGVRVVV